MQRGFQQSAELSSDCPALCYPIRTIVGREIRSLSRRRENQPLYPAHDTAEQHDEDNRDGPEHHVPFPKRVSDADTDDCEKGECDDGSEKNASGQRRNQRSAHTRDQTAYQTADKVGTDDLRPAVLQVYRTIWSGYVADAYEGNQNAGENKAEANAPSDVLGHDGPACIDFHLGISVIGAVTGGC